MKLTGALLAILLLAGCGDPASDPATPEVSVTPAALVSVAPSPRDSESAAPEPSPSPEETTAAEVPPEPTPTETTPVETPTTDPDFGSCAKAKAAGYGPYYADQDPEYNWYRDADKDGIVCE